MLLITCPWCGVRPELEFSYGGEAHIARPADPASVSDADWTTFLHLRTNPKGVHRGAVASHAWLRAILQCRA